MRAPTKSVVRFDEVLVKLETLEPRKLSGVVSTLLEALFCGSGKLELQQSAVFNSLLVGRT